MLKILPQLLEFLQKNPIPPHIEHLGLEIVSLSISKFNKESNLILLNQLKKIDAYQSLCAYIDLIPYAKIEVEKLKFLIESLKDLNHINVQKWVKGNKKIFNNQYVSFGLDFMDSGPNLYLKRVDEWVHPVEFLEMMQYWECMWLLTGAYYELPQSKRPVEDVNSYYYNAPDPSDPSDLEKICKFLGINLL